MKYERLIQRYLHRYDDLIDIFFILISAYLLVQISRWLLNHTVRKRMADKDQDATSLKFLRNTIRVLIYSIAGIWIIYKIPALRTVAISLFASAGILAAIAAFASQQALSNIVSGFFLVIFKPIRIHDNIRVGTDIAGVVEDINLRHTVVRTYDARRLIIPNSTMNTATIVNSDIIDTKTCEFLLIPVGYEYDLERVMDILREEVSAHPDFMDTRSVEEKAGGGKNVRILVKDFRENYLLLRVSIWGADPDIVYDMCADLRLKIKLRFDKEGIRFPAPIRRVELLKGDF